MKFFKTLDGLALVALLALANCGGDGGGNGGSDDGDAPSTVSGNLEFLSFTDGSSGSVANVPITVTGFGPAASGATNATGLFTISGAPTGDITIRFQPPECTTPVTVEVEQVVAGSAVTVDDVVAFDCEGQIGSLIREVLEGIIRDDPVNANGFTICVRSGGTFQSRAMTSDDAEEFGGTRGDLIAADGIRFGGSDPDDYAAGAMLLARGQEDPCGPLP